jgi:hypothetical protein
MLMNDSYFLFDKSQYIKFISLHHADLIHRSFTSDLCIYLMHTSLKKKAQYKYAHIFTISTNNTGMRLVGTYVVVVLQKHP